MVFLSGLSSTKLKLTKLSEVQDKLDLVANIPLGKGVPVRSLGTEGLLLLSKRYVA